MGKITAEKVTAEKVTAENVTLGKDLRKKRSEKWVFIAIAIIAIIALILSFIGLCYHHKECPLDYRDIIHGAVAVIAICATFIVVHQIFNVVETRNTIKELEGEIEKLYNDAKEYRQEKEILDQIVFKTEASILKSEGDSSRMMATFLAEIKKPIWSLGWMTRAIGRYGECCTKYPEVMNKDSYQSIVKTLVPGIVDDIRNFRRNIKSRLSGVTSASARRSIILDEVDRENNDKDIDLLMRTFKDMIRYRIFMREKNGNHVMINVVESHWQNIYISRFIKLIKSVLKPDEIQKCSKMSRLDHNVFMEEVNRY